MALVNANFRMDEDLKKEMEEVCQAMGMNMTTAFTIYAKKLTREKRIPFEITADLSDVSVLSGHKRRGGTLQGTVTMAEDFFETPEGFEEYM